MRVWWCVCERVCVSDKRVHVTLHETVVRNRMVPGCMGVARGLAGEGVVVQVAAVHRIHVRMKQSSGV